MGGDPWPLLGVAFERAEREKEPKTAATTEDPKNPASSPFSFRPLNGAAHPSSSSHFPSSFSLGGFVFVSRSNPTSQGQERKKKKIRLLARLLGLAPKAMSESCGIFFFRRRHFSFAVEEEERKIPSPPSFHLPPPPPQLLIRVPRWFVAVEAAAAGTRGQWSIPIPLYTT